MSFSPLDVEGLISFWDFQEAAGCERIAQGPYSYALQERRGAIPRVEDGVFGKYSALFDGTKYLEIPRAQCPALNIHGPKAQVTVVTWLKRKAAQPHGCEAVAGMWNEYGKRQYCLFLNLGIDYGADQVGGHISGTGGPSPGDPFCLEAGIGSTPVPLDVWQCCAFTYDGEWIRAYLNGQFDPRGARNPYHYSEGIFDGGPDGSDFTVGAVARPEDVNAPWPAVPYVGNWFYGLLGGLAVYNRALSDEEIGSLSKETLGGAPSAE
jgi:hypothetical protein